MSTPENESEKTGGPGERRTSEGLTGDFTSDLASELSGAPIDESELEYSTDPEIGVEPEEDSSAGTTSVWRTGRHRTDIGHLVMGLAFLAFVGCWALIQADVVSGDEIRWLMPIPWVVAGAVGLAVTATVSLRRHRR